MSAGCHVAEEQMHKKGTRLSDLRKTIDNRNKLSGKVNDMGLWVYP